MNIFKFTNTRLPKYKIVKKKFYIRTRLCNDSWSEWLFQNKIEYTLNGGYFTRDNMSLAWRIEMIFCTMEDQFAYEIKFGYMAVNENNLIFDND